MVAKEKFDWDEYLRLFIKTIMANTLPILWLFACQPEFNVRFDGVIFWTIYFVLSVLYSVLFLWPCHRIQPWVSKVVYLPDWEKPPEEDIPTPIFGAVAATYQPIVFVSVFVIYRLTM